MAGNCQPWPFPTKLPGFPGYGFDSLTRLVQNPWAACYSFIMIIYYI